MSTRLALRIQERFEKLAPSERKLAQLVLDRQDDILTYSATELAELAGVSKATAARLFQSLGYRDFNEVRLQAREERNRTAPFHQSAAPPAESSGARSVGAHLQAEIANLTRTFEEMRSDTVAAAAELIAEAPRVWLLSHGAEEGLMRYARLQLARLRPDVMLLGAQPGSWGEDLALTGPRDALLIASVAPRPKILRPLVDYARTTRMNVVAITDPRGALWAQRFARVVLTAHVASSRTGGASHTAIFSVLRLLSSALADRIGRAAAQRSELIAEIHEELDDLD
jgi:DNA-binding MurR/RpiR family transcriptional regulator